MNEQALERFREACGLSAPLALECEAASPSAAALERVFQSPFVLVGRDPKAELFLDDTRVSRRHAFLQAVAGRILVTDLDSRTKVFWEGEESPRFQGWLDPEKYIRVGPCRMRRSGGPLTRGDQSESAAFPSPAGHEQVDFELVPRAALELPIRVDERPSLWPVIGPLALVGRSDHCQLTVTDDSVSRFHAALVPTPSGLWVIDLLAREGVHVNGQRVRWAWLADGDALRLGRLTFVVRYETPPDQIARVDVPLEAGASPAEQPGTDLAISPRPSGAGRGELVPRPGRTSHVALTAVSAPARIGPASFAPSGAEVWQPSIPYSPGFDVMWRQQMQLMESFHNDMILMVQMFVAMHREHSASVRHELDMVQRLTQELSALQAKTAQIPGSADARSPSGVNPGSGELEAVRGRDRLKNAERPIGDRHDKGSQPPRPRSIEPPAPVNAPGGAVPLTQGSVPPGIDGANVVEDEQIHALLTQRIAELQRQRQGYWQRILSTINR
jgi:pSer/pThr/pTyr-binding forkhead associated (FHA) protein